MREIGDERALGDELKQAAGTAAQIPPELERRFAQRLSEVASHPDRVPISFNGDKVDARLGGTLLAAALKNRKRLMHVCGGRTLCSTCRVTVDDGAENLSPMQPFERFSLRYHLSMSSRTRLACQARVLGPCDVSPVFPLCGDLEGSG